MSRTVRTLWVLLVCLALVMAVGMWLHWGQAPDAGEKDNLRIIKPYVTWSGARSQITKRSYFRITSSTEWSNLWLRHVEKGVEKDSFNRIVVPEVNFEEWMIIAVFQGKGWQNNGVVLDAITEDADEMYVRFKNQPYSIAIPPGGVNREKQVTAYGIFVIPRSPKPLVLEEKVGGYKGGPPAWEERVRFGRLE